MALLKLNERLKQLVRPALLGDQVVQPLAGVFLRPAGVRGSIGRDPVPLRVAFLVRLAWRWIACSANSPTCKGYYRRFRRRRLRNPRSQAVARARRTDRGIHRWRSGWRVL